MPALFGCVVDVFIYWYMNGVRLRDWNRNMFFNCDVEWFLNLHWYVFFHCDMIRFVDRDVDCLQDWHFHGLGNLDVNSIGLGDFNWDCLWDRYWDRMGN